MKHKNILEENKKLRQFNVNTFTHEKLIKEQPYCNNKIKTAKYTM